MYPAGAPGGLTLGVACLPISHHGAHQQWLAAGVDPEMMCASLHDRIERLQLN